ncbi:MAG: 3-deoxy-8-phosphooctulonate synthase [Deferribacteres bacterium]|nr:3-deoxy-8-phosphooctulonate synthase [candidate division KSB1 bacterium]MCB9511337.1 3-deoxy-8-phosphooctulonate synthase [Deferribacteres bacterium]
MQAIKNTKSFEVGNVHVGGGQSLVLICGPCVIEDRDTMWRAAEGISKIAEKLQFPLIFKSSYLKDNRSSELSYQGPGLEAGLETLAALKRDFGFPVLSDIHNEFEARTAAEVLDVLQIPAYLSMQTSLAIAAGKTGKPVNVKKGQFLDPGDMSKVIKKIENTGNQKIMVTERGASFGYHNLVVDMRSLVTMRNLGYPVVYDPTHSVRVYGIPSDSPDGGKPEYVPALTRAGVAAGIDVLFIESHPDPTCAKCDAASQWPLSKLEGLLKQVREVDNTLRRLEAISY